MVAVVPYIRSVVCRTSLVLPPRIHGEDGAQTNDLWPSGNLSVFVPYDIAKYCMVEVSALFFLLTECVWSIPAVALHLCHFCLCPPVPMVEVSVTKMRGAV